ESDNNEDNNEESNVKNSQNIGEKYEDNQGEGRGEGSKEVVIWTANEKGNVEFMKGSTNLLSIVVHEGGSIDAPEMMEMTKR
ncbi:hypothetical protein HAX54_013887, partial [Datura stramonium]|nr:hypothetical protein [Datura stramonium]